MCLCIESPIYPFNTRTLAPSISFFPIFFQLVSFPHTPNQLSAPPATFGNFPLRFFSQSVDFHSLIWHRIISLVSDTYDMNAVTTFQRTHKLIAAAWSAISVNQTHRPEIRRSEKIFFKIRRATLTTFSELNSKNAFDCDDRRTWRRRRRRQDETRRKRVKNGEKKKSTEK